MKYFFLLYYIVNFQVLYCQDDLEYREFDIEKKSIHFPRHIGKWNYCHSLGLSLTYLPKDWLEEANSLPMVYYKSNFHLFNNIIISTDVKSIYVANDFAIGPSYNLKLNEDWFLGAGYQFSYGLGNLYGKGFDNSLYVFGHRPYLKIGLQLDHFAITFKGGVDFTEKIHFDAGTTNLSGNIETLNGYNFSLFLEQRMFKFKAFSMGMTLNYNKFNILGWPAFTYTRRMYSIPEFTALLDF